MTIVLQASEVVVTFDSFRAVDGASFVLEQDQCRGLIGPNGAGKSTLFNALTGVVLPPYGSVKLTGEELVGKTQAGIARLGLARTFQTTRTFPGRTVWEHVLIAAESSMKQGRLQNRIEPQAGRALEIVGLADKGNVRSEALTNAARKLLMIAMCVAREPKALLLDEPAAGLDDSETTQMSNVIKHIRAEYRVAILLIEHKLSLVMDLCEAVTVLDAGRIISEGSPAAVSADPAVIEAYLGVEVVRPND